MTGQPAFFKSCSGSCQEGYVSSVWLKTTFAVHPRHIPPVTPRAQGSRLALWKAGHVVLLYILTPVLILAYTAQISGASDTLKQAVTLVAVGDIRLDGPIGRLFRSEGALAPTGELKAYLAGDIVFGNLECAITQRGNPADKKWTFRAPQKNLEILKKAGFTVVNLANNHVMDYGPEGLFDTIAALNRSSMTHFGAGKTLGEARRPIVIEKNGLRVGFLGLTSTIPEFIWAKAKRPGVAYSDFRYFAEWIRKAKEACNVLVVSFHGGTELDENPNSIQSAFAHEAVDAGADIVLGHHPHVLQPAEIYKGKIILYSLGNFLFVSPNPATRLSVIAKIHISKEGIHFVEFIPVDINAGRLRLASPEDAETMRKALDREGALTQYPERLSLKIAP